LLAVFSCAQACWQGALRSVRCPPLTFRTCARLGHQAFDLPHMRALGASASAPTLHLHLLPTLPGHEAGLGVHSPLFLQPAGGFLRLQRRVQCWPRTLTTLTTLLLLPTTGGSGCACKGSVCAYARVPTCVRAVKAPTGS